MDEIILGKIGADEEGKTAKEPVFITLSEFKGTRYLSIRKYYQESGEWKPTKKGITLSADLYKEVTAILESNNEKIENHFAKKT